MGFFELDSRQIIYIVVIFILCLTIGCLCCAIAGAGLYCWLKQNTQCCVGGSGKQKDEDVVPYYPFGSHPFNFPQNYFCGAQAGDGEDAAPYGCVAAPMNQYHQGTGGTVGGVAKSSSVKKSKVNPLNL